MSRRSSKQSPLTKILSAIVAVIVLLLAGAGVIDLDTDTASVQTQQTQIIETKADIDTADEKTGPVIEPQAIEDYLFEHGQQPDNFITKKEAQKRGWDSDSNYVSDVAPGYSIGGDRFGNYEGLLPDKDGRTWYEADCYYTKGKRNACRIVYSNDGLVYYTDDHYESFTKMKPSGK